MKKRLGAAKGAHAPNASVERPWRDPKPFSLVQIKGLCYALGIPTGDQWFA